MADVRLADIEMQGPWLLGQSELTSLEALVRQLVEEARAKRQTLATELAEQRIADKKKQLESDGREYIKFLRSLGSDDFESDRKERLEDDRATFKAYKEQVNAESQIVVKHRIQINLKDKTTLTGASLAELLAEPSLSAGIPNKLVIISTATVPWSHPELEDFEIRIDCPDYDDQ